jgi:hypothetical protein
MKQLTPSRRHGRQKRSAAVNLQLRSDEFVDPAAVKIDDLEAPAIDMARAMGAWRRGPGHEMDGRVGPILRA